MDINKDRYSFEDFKKIIGILRSENGCPWDREQTHESIRKNLIEESYEFINEVNSNSKEGMCEELGDVLLQVLLHAQIAKDNHEFTIDDVIDGIAKKMIFRHPHVFGGEVVSDAEKAIDVFKSRKEKEKHFKNKIEEIEHIPTDYPALIKGYKLCSKLEKLQPLVWKKTFDERCGKVTEELEELKEANLIKGKEAVEEELGDVLMSVVFLGKTLELDSEVALSGTFKKVLSRLKYIEECCEENGEKIEEILPEKFEFYWEKSKKH